MIARQFTHRVAAPEDLPPVWPGTRVVGALNPAVAEIDGRVVLLVRQVEEVAQQRDGFVPSPRFDPQRGPTVDWLPVETLDLRDPRLFVDRTTGLVRLRFVSVMRVVHLADDGHTIDRVGPAVMPELADEAFGLEDPRITTIDGTHYITAVAVSEAGIVTKLLSTRDFVTFERHGVIFCPDNKDVMLFPEKINGQYAALHRPIPGMRFNPPSIWTATSPDLVHWGHHHRLIGGGDLDRVGGGVPPIRTHRGWLILYHANHRLPRADDGKTRFMYVGLAALTAHDAPHRLLADAREPFMQPEIGFETAGFVDNVVFPTGAVRRGDTLHIYYGAADAYVGVVGYRLDDLMGTLKQ